MPNRVTHADEVPYDNTTSGMTADDVQDAIDELKASGGGSGSTVPGWMEHLAVDGGEDEGQEFTGSLGGTLVEPSGTSTWLSQRGLLSVNFHSQAASNLTGRMYPLIGTWQVGSYVVCRVRALALYESYSAYGLVMSDGTTTSSNIMAALEWVRADTHSPGNLETLTGTFGSITVPGVRVKPHNVGLSWIYLRLTEVSSGSWRMESSPDGISWTTMGMGNTARSLTPTHYGVGVTRWNGGAEQSVATFEYLRVYNLA